MKRMVGTVFLVIGSLGTASVAERVVFAQSPRYPAWLATGIIQTLAPGSLAQLRARSCGGDQPIEVMENQQQFVLRCGLWWPTSKTWIVPRTAQNTAILEDPKAF